MGHLTCSINNALVVPGLNNTLSADYAWGIYRDVDIQTSGTDLPAYSAGYSNSWMVHKSGALSVPSLFSQNTATQAYSATVGATDYSYRRYELNLRKYKRTLDSFNDTLILSFENGTSPGANAGDISFSFYFRMLLLE